MKQEINNEPLLCKPNFGQWSTSTQLAVVAVHAVRRAGEDARERALPDPAGPQQHHPVRPPGLRRLPGRVAGDHRVRGRPAPAAPVRVPGGAGAGLGAGDAGGGPGQQEGPARLADAPAVELGLQAEAAPPHAGQHGAQI